MPLPFLGPQPALYQCAYIDCYVSFILTYLSMIVILLARAKRSTYLHTSPEVASQSGLGTYTLA